MRFILTCLLATGGILIAQDKHEVRLLSYNLRNFLSMETYTNGEKTGERYKPKEEIEALIEIIANTKPDVLGVCEIGNKNDLKRFKTYLTKAGCKFKYSEYVQAADSERHLALLSNIPIQAVHSRSDLTYHIGDREFPLRRGLLHVELQVGEHTIHTMGVHFKSKRPTKEADQSDMRLREARLVREVATEVLEQNPEAYLMLYGDLNDSYKSPTLDAIKGHYNSPTRLIPLQPTDSRGEYWTHYWDWEREYGVFDYCLVSRSLFPHVNEDKTYILDSKQVLTASDHRPILLTLEFNQER